MERLSLLLDTSTVEMLHLLARKSDKTIGALVQEMALEKDMSHAVSAAQVENSAEFNLRGDTERTGS